MDFARIKHYEASTVCEILIKARAGERPGQLCREYGITPRILELWISQYRNFSTESLAMCD